MSYNPNFYNSFRGNNFTFQNRPPLFSPNIPPPPVPPQYFMPSIPQCRTESDEDFVKRFDSAVALKENAVKPKSLTITEVKESLRNLVILLNKAKEKERVLSSNSDTLPDEEWNTTVAEIKHARAQINDILSKINNLNLDALRKVLAKRSAKRARLKRLQLEKKQEKESKIKEAEERSRKIDENLQKIKDEIKKLEQDKEAKVQADVILREVVRKKSDAKKCIAKLNALIKLRKARVNSARGRGENVSENETVNFNINLEKVKCLWTQKLATYEKEESDLRAQLELKPENASDDMGKQVADTLDKWRQFLFGGGLPQVDFGGDAERFVALRLTSVVSCTCAMPVPPGEQSVISGTDKANGGTFLGACDVEPILLDNIGVGSIFEQ